MRKGSGFRSQSSARSGHSLIEVLVAVAVTSVILSGLTVALHGMYRADRAARRDLEATAGVARLAQRFRTDAHAAEVASIEEAVLSFKLADSQSVSYEFADNRVERIVRGDEKVEHRDGFRLAKGSSVEWELSEQGSDKFVGLKIVGPAGESSRVEARVGGDRRFEATK